MNRAQDCFATCTWYIDASTNIFWSLIAQYVIGVKEEISKEVIVSVLDKLQDSTQEPICGHTCLDCCCKGGVVVCRDVMYPALCKIGPRRVGKMDP